MHWNFLVSPLAEITLPEQFGNIISFAVLAVLAGCSVTAMIKIATGFRQWIRGEDEGVPVVMKSIERNFYEIIIINIFSAAHVGPHFAGLRIKAQPYDIQICFVVAKVHFGLLSRRSAIRGQLLDEVAHLGHLGRRPVRRHVFELFEGWWLRKFWNVD